MTINIFVFIYSTSLKKSFQYLIYQK